MQRHRFITFVTAGGMLAGISMAPLAVQAQRTRATKPPAAKASVKSAAVSKVAAPAKEPLPLRDVVLFSSGVGYFEREGRISGKSGLDLTFRAEQINDVLKSLVLFDAAGTVQPVTYTTQESVARRLEAAGISLESEATLGQLLRQFQGARLRLQTRKGVVEGLLVSVSNKNVSAAPPRSDNEDEARRSIWIPPQWPLTVEVANVMTANGLRSVSLEDVSNVRILDARLDRELRESLRLMAKSNDEKKRSVRLNFGSGGARSVRAGYLLEAPIWKTSYRIVIADKPDAKTYLQGWAIVENMTDDDWTNVNLSLVSGRPISFIQDLSQPIYVPRPVVAPQIIGSPNPQTYRGALESAAANQPVAMAPDEDSNESAARGLQGPPGAAGPAGVSGDKRMSGAEAKLALPPRFVTGLNLQHATGWNDAISQSVAAQAEGAERGELFQYAISQPVTLPKQQAALVPIVSENIGGEKLSIFDANASNLYALNGFQLRNTTGLHLSGGPITIFDGGIYGGDAQINDVAPGETRLISYAVDLGLEVKRENPVFRRETVSILARSGILTINHRQFRDLTYTFRNKSTKAKTVLVQQNIEAGFELVEPKQADEKTAEEYRFKVAVPAGKTVTFKVTTQQPISQTMGLFDMNVNMLLEHTRNGVVSPALKAALEQVVTRRQRITELQATLAQMDLKIQEIDQDQNRIRNNMNGLSKESDLYKRYVAKLNEQETELEKLREQRALTRDAEFEAQRELREFVGKLTIE